MHEATIETDADQTARDVQILCQLMGRADYCTVPGLAMHALLLRRNGSALRDWEAFQGSWSRLEVDEDTAADGRCRRRRHATLSAQPAFRTPRVEPHQPHHQRVTFNPFNAGAERHVAPIEDEILSGETMASLLTLACEIFGRLSPFSSWHIEVHQFRSEMDGSGVGRPTPEGTQRVGVSFVMMVMIDRNNVDGGATEVFDAEEHLRDRFTLVEPLATVIVNDERMRHGVSPTCQLDIDLPASRDMLVITFRHVCDAATRP